MISETRDSPNPDDTCIVKLDGKSFVVSHRYLKCTRKELYLRFIRDMKNIAIQQNPGVALSDHQLVSQTVFLSWLREWSFIKDEVWHVCICKDCYNIKQYLNAYFRMTKKVHGSGLSVSKRTTSSIPIRRSLNPHSCFQSEPNDFEDEHDEDCGIDAKVECTDAKCKSSVTRARPTFLVPRDAEIVSFLMNEHQLQLNGSRLQEWYVLTTAMLVRLESAVHVVPSVL